MKFPNLMTTTYYERNVLLTNNCVNFIKLLKKYGTEFITNGYLTESEFNSEPDGVFISDPVEVAVDKNTIDRINWWRSDYKGLQRVEIGDTVWTGELKSCLCDNSHFFDEDDLYYEL